MATTPIIRSILRKINKKFKKYLVKSIVITIMTNGGQMTMAVIFTYKRYYDINFFLKITLHA